jgi:predicted porin
VRAKGSVTPAGTRPGADFFKKQSITQGSHLMKSSSLCVMAVLAASANCAFAQSNVSMYGVLDMGIVNERGGAAGPATKLTSGMSNGSRLGFQGTEDLGNGLSALFLMESGFQADTGVSGQGGILFGRQVFAGLRGGFGTVTLGRQYAPEYSVTVFVDPFSSGLAGDSKDLMQAVGDSSSRMNNAVKYATPVVAGFSGEFAYGAGEVAGNAGAGRQFGGALAYAAGPLEVRLGYHNRNNDTASMTLATTRNTILAGTYKLNVVKLHAAYAVNKGPFSSPLRNAANPFGYAVAPTLASISDDSTDALVGVTMPYGVHTFLASYIHKNDKTAANRDASQWAMGYRYALSKRTDFYGAYGMISNKNGASYTVGSSIEGGSGNRALDVGIRHSF